MKIGALTLALKRAQKAVGDVQVGVWDVHRTGNDLHAVRLDAVTPKFVVLDLYGKPLVRFTLSEMEETKR